MSDARSFVRIDYTNHRGVRGERHIAPSKIWFGVTDWHKTPQWFVTAYDMNKMEKRDFAMADIHLWRAL